MRFAGIPAGTFEGGERVVNFFILDDLGAIFLGWR